MGAGRFHPSETVSGRALLQSAATLELDTCFFFLVSRHCSDVDRARFGTPVTSSSHCPRNVFIRHCRAKGLLAHRLDFTRETIPDWPCHPECADFLLMDSPIALPMIPPLYDYDDDSDI
ncbi:AAEL012976-PA [Aedes aegypti]|uniref:AAEL012976-PA n=1 Tax=Aedes aegypti TaxID=7159 RepID=Q0IE97_AEDAE|nr:AAEL012976-PA [Aedes aegypti]